MAIDATIPLQAQQFKLPTAMERVSLEDMALQYRQRQQDFEVNNKVTQLAQQPGMVDQQTGFWSPQGLTTLASISPQYAQKASQQRQTGLMQLSQMRQANVQEQVNLGLLEKRENEQRTEVSQHLNEVWASTYDQCIKGGGNEQVCGQKAEQGFQEELHTMESSGRLTFMKQGEKEAALGQKRDIMSVRARLPRKEMKAEEKEASIEQTRTEKATASAEQATAKLDLARQKLDLEREKQATKEQKAKESEGGRAQVFTNRMITSANNAIKDLENLVQLPLSASTGWFAGRQQGGGLMSATKEVLTNKATSQEVQAFSVMSAGIQRNLASIEAVGLMPSGSLTHQMDSVILREGDTNLTKAAKLAQIRQIIEGGLEPVLANPKVPQEVKDFVNKIMDQAAKAVPYTQSDVIKVMTSQNPKATLGGFMKKETTGQQHGVDNPANPYSNLNKPDAPARVRTIEEAKQLKPGTRFIDPNGVERIR